MSTNAGRMSAEMVQIPPTRVTVYEALYRRRMAGGFQRQAVPKDVLQRVLDVAVWAPNHKMTEPWRFFVLPQGGTTRGRLAEMIHGFTMEKSNNAQRAEAARNMIIDPPVLMFVLCVPGQTEEMTRENYAAVMIAAHNVSLACVAEGLAVEWETGGPTRYPQLNQVLGADPSWLYPLMVSFGYPTQLLASRRTPAEQFIRWND